MSSTYRKSLEAETIKSRQANHKDFILGKNVNIKSKIRALESRQSVASNQLPYGAVSADHKPLWSQADNLQGTSLAEYARKSESVVNFGSKKCLFKKRGSLVNTVDLKYPKTKQHSPMSSQKMLPKTLLNSYQISCESTNKKELKRIIDKLNTREFKRKKLYKKKAAANGEEKEIEESLN